MTFSAYFLSVLKKFPLKEAGFCFKLVEQRLKIVTKSLSDYTMNESMFPAQMYKISVHLVVELPPLRRTLFCFSSSCSYSFSMALLCRDIGIEKEEVSWRFTFGEQGAVSIIAFQFTCLWGKKWRWHIWRRVKGRLPVAKPSFQALRTTRIQVTSRALK